MIGVPITLPKEPTLVSVKVPFWVSSGFNLELRARLARSFTALVKPIRFNSSAFFITGTIRFPLGKAAAIPILISFFLIIWVPFTDTLIIGKSLIALLTASTKIGVKVIFSFSRFSKFLFTFSRHITILVTSASTKEVTCAEVCLLMVM
ncbi:hypothetical protein D3C86_947150 [compost metagenome]